MSDAVRPVESDQSDSRTRILRAVLEIVASDGLDSLTHRGVARMARVSLGTTTYHFDSRKTLIREAFTLYMDDYEQSLAHALSETRITSIDMLIRFLVATTVMQAGKHGLARTEYQMMLAAGQDEALASRVNIWRRALEGWLIDPLERLGFTRPLTSARVLIALCRGTEFEALCSAVPLTADELTTRIKGALDGLMPRA